MCLPLHTPKAAAAPAGQAQAAAAPASHEDGRSAPCRGLVAENNVDTLESLAMLLAHAMCTPSWDWSVASATCATRRCSTLACRGWTESGRAASVRRPGQAHPALALTGWDRNPTGTDRVMPASTRTWRSRRRGGTQGGAVANAARAGGPCGPEPRGSVTPASARAAICAQDTDGEPLKVSWMKPTPPATSHRERPRAPARRSALRAQRGGAPGGTSPYCAAARFA
jgi:hypothetical protein